MAAIWTRRIIAGTQVFAKCPARFQADVLVGLKTAVVEGKITEHDFKLMTGTDYVA